jgi:hypothetical protein
VPGRSATTDESGRYCPEFGGALGAVDAVDAGAVTMPLGASGQTLVGKRFDDFLLEAVLGGGRFGTVYRGRQLGLDRTRATRNPPGTRKVSQ